MGKTTWNQLRHRVTGGAFLRFPGPRGTSSRFYFSVVAAVAALLLFVSPVLADGPVHVFLWSTTGASWNTNCSYLADHPEYEVDIIDVGECYDFSEIVLTYPGTGYDHFKLCTEDQLGESPPESELLKLSWTASAHANGSTSVVKVMDYNDSYDSGMQTGDISHNLVSASEWYSVTTLNVPGFRLHSYIGGASQVIAEVALNVCLWAVTAEPTSDYCADGYEVLTDTVSLEAGETWEGEAVTPYSRLYTRYTFRDVVGNMGVHHSLIMGLNEFSIARDFYSDPSQEWDEDLQMWVNRPFSYTVPNVTVSTLPDYLPGGYSEGPTATLSVATDYNDIELLSACVVEQPHSEYCMDGYEALDEDVYLSAFNGAWSDTVEVTSTHVVVRYVVQNPAIDPAHDWLLGKFEPGIDYTLYYVEARVPVNYGTVTFTLPTTDVIKIYDSELYLEFYNRLWPMILKSVCVIDGTEDYMQQLDAEDCLDMVNPDFVDGLDGWNTQLSVDWSGEEENGAVDLQGGQIWQGAPGETGKLGVLEVRARANGALTMTIGTSRSALVNGGPQMEDRALSDYYALSKNKIFVMPGDPLVVGSMGAWVDYVCFVDPDGLLVVSECDLPVWDPEGSGDSLIIYVFHFIFDVLKWVVCEIVRAISLAVNWLYDRIWNLIYRIPGFDMSLKEWIRQAVASFLDYFGITIPEIYAWFEGVVEQFSLWLRDIWLAYVWWLAEQLEMDPYVLWDTMAAIWNEASAFYNAIIYELWIELNQGGHLFKDMANVFIVLASGVREGVSGTGIQPIGEGLGGTTDFIWDGWEFVNEVFSWTPISALNIILLGTMAYGLLVWTGKKLTHIIEVCGS